MLVNMSDMSNMQYQEELAELQNEGSVKTLFNIKGVIAWLCEETEIKYLSSTKCGFRAVNDLLVKKKSAGYNTSWRLETKANQIGT